VVSILSSFYEGSKFYTIIFCILAAFRVLLVFSKFNLTELPISRFIGVDKAERFHKLGLYFCIGYLVLFLPEIIFS
jgi:hypothetical protein